ncbi:uncharacterized protein LOC132756953, partial [Ruditapes philippinarum]|uniref:uncharacterized protein LOC132756953 n=1 Tax=Ruditapes philippinarum TaxID=129788 RepID=UPI00295B8E06
NDTLNLSDVSGTQQNRTGDFKNIVKKPVHEYQTIDDESNDEEDENSDKTKITKEESREVETRNILQCLQCRYLARTKHHLNLHLDSHKDPMKIYTCSVCDYRGDKFSVIKHIYSVPHPTQAKVLENGKSLYEKLTNEPDKEQKEQIKNDSSKSDSKSSIF